MARKKHSIMNTTIFIVLIITMNLLGISYGYWQDGLASTMQFSTGYIEPVFLDEVKVKRSEDMNKSKVSLKMNKRTENNFIKLTGEIDRGKRGKLTLYYTVINNGSLPIKFDDETFYDMNKKLLSQKAGKLKILKSEPSEKILYPNNHHSLDKDANGSLTLQIDAPEEVGNYEFEIKMPYKQWTEN